MEIPERLWRFPTTPARIKLAERFTLAYDDSDQDWEWTVDVDGRVDELIATYEEAELSDDERWCLMEMIIQSVEDLDCGKDQNVREKVLLILEKNIELHIYSICYWACLDSELEDSWGIAPAMRAILNRHRARFDFPPHDV